MKISSTAVTIVTALLCLASIPAFAGGYGFDRQQPNTVGTVVSLIDSLPMEYLDEEEILDLLHMYEEEKVARDVYSTLFGVWGHWVFEHIAMSEQKHMDAVGALLARYEIALPENATIPNLFESTEMQNLYDALVEQATIEDLDIYDLQEYINLTDNEDIQTVYQNLLRGSRNHMRSFIYQLTLNDITYTPQYLTQEEFDNIISTERERGLISGDNFQAFQNYPGNKNKANSPHQQFERGCYLPHFSLIRCTAASIFFRSPKAERRKYPSPLGPKPLPGVPTT